MSMQTHRLRYFLAVAMTLPWMVLSLVGGLAWGDEIFTGPVGIGTSTPASPLHIQRGDGSAGLRITRGGSAGSDYEFNLSGGLGLWDWEHSAYRLYVQDESGNVGIGTTTPSAKLSIDSDGFGLGMSTK